MTIGKIWQRGKYIYVVGQNMADRRTFNVLLKVHKAFDLRARETVEVYNGNVQTTYYTEDWTSSYQRSFKYEGAVIYFCDAEGKIVEIDETRNMLAEHAERILKLEQDEWFDNKGRKINGR